MIKVLDILHDTTVDGPGFRTSFYLSGCAHKCPGCHNPQSWDFEGGREMSVEEMMQEIVADPFADVTFSGGDPLYQAEALLPLLRRIKAETDKTVWVYTGFTYEHLPEAAKPLLDYIDVLVDGPFVQALRDEDLLFRGSSNQRLVDIRLSREAGSVVEWSRDF